MTFNDSKLAFGRAVSFSLSFNGRYAMHTPAPKRGVSNLTICPTVSRKSAGFVSRLSEKRSRPHPYSYKAKSKKPERGLFQALSGKTKTIYDKISLSIDGY
jgi:hypothetical protein